MDNSLMYYSPAEIQFRRQRAERSKARKRLARRAPWHRKHAGDETS
jgi:hypothetical protein